MLPDSKIWVSNPEGGWGCGGAICVPDCLRNNVSWYNTSHPGLYFFLWNNDYSCNCLNMLINAEDIFFYKATQNNRLKRPYRNARFHSQPQIQTTQQIQRIPEHDRKKGMCEILNFYHALNVRPLIFHYLLGDHREHQNYYCT